MIEEIGETEGRAPPSNDNQLSFFRQSLQLIAAFREITDADLRQAVIRVVQDIAEADKKAAPASPCEDGQE